MPFKFQKGFIPIVFILLIVAAIAGVVVVQKNRNSEIKVAPNTQVINKFPTPTPTKSPSPSPTESPSPTPLPTAVPTPNPQPTRSPSPRPVTPAPVSGPPGAGYSSITVATEKGNFSASVLSIDLNSARMITDTGNEGECGSGCTALTLQDYVTRNGGFAGINGTYFCPAEPAYSGCGAGNNYDFPVWNTRLGRWINGGNLGWNSRSIFYTDGSGARFMQNASGFSGGLNAGVVNYPGLVSDGVVQIDDNQSGLSDKQKAVGTKVGIGYRDSKNVMIVIGRNLNMQQFAYVFKSLGAKGALNLDDGGSTALYYNGRYIFGPGRNIPNAIIFAR